MIDDTDIELLAALSIPDTATLIGIYADGAHVVGGRDEITCSEHGRGECAHAEEFGGGVRVVDVADIADEVAQSRAVQKRVLERVDENARGKEEDGGEGQIPSDMPVATSEDPPAAIREFHPQDWLVVIEALVAWAGNPNDPEMLTDPRKGRAWNLVSTIASEQDFPDDTPLKHVDDSWGAREEQDR